MKLPMNEKHDRVMQCLEEGLSMLTFDGSDEKRPMGVIARSCHLYKGNLTQLIVSTKLSICLLGEITVIC